MNGQSRCAACSQPIPWDTHLRLEEARSVVTRDDWGVPRVVGGWVSRMVQVCRSCYDEAQPVEPAQPIDQAQMELPHTNDDEPDCTCGLCSLCCGYDLPTGAGTNRYGG
jgi:hypothetical protein